MAEHFGYAFSNVNRLYWGMKPCVAPVTYYDLGRQPSSLLRLQNMDVLKVAHLRTNDVSSQLGDLRKSAIPKE